MNYQDLNAIFSALGAKCTVLDYSSEQCKREREIAKREGYDVEIIQFDMTRRLPFEDETFDLIFHPVSNSYVEEVKPIFKECFRVLKKDGILLCGNLYEDTNGEGKLHEYNIPTFLATRAIKL